MSLYMLQLLVLLVHLLLLSLYSLALHLLIGRILADEGKAAIHLCQILGTEDEHQLVLNRMMTAHIAHGTDILVLAVLQLLLKRFQLCLQNADIAVNMMNILLDTVNLLLTLVYFSVQRHQVFKTFLHIRLISLQSLLLLSDLLPDRSALSLQTSDRGIAIGCCPAFCSGWRSWFGCLSGRMTSAVRLSGRSSSLLFRSYGSLSHRLLLGRMLLRKRCEREGDCHDE